MKTGESYWYSDQTKEVIGENGYLLPRELWPSLPGGMPYYVII